MVGCEVTGAGVVGTVGTKRVGTLVGFSDACTDGRVELLGAVEGKSLGALLIVGAVGLLDGVPVGAVGKADGVADGIAEGGAVIVGLPDGVGVGAVGDDDGVPVGDVGSDDGTGVGAGLSVGTNEGACELGELDGAGDGFGDSVGSTDGLEVGDGVMVGSNDGGKVG